MIDYAKIMTQASLLRVQLGEDCTSPIDIFSLVQNIESLTIVYYPMGDNLSGMCIKGEHGNSVIAINSSMTLGRQRFSMAHELYHLYFDDNMMSVCAKKINYGKDIEKSADMFASYFLMPEPALMVLAEKMSEKHSDKQLTLNDIIKVEQYYGVSHQATVYRLMHTSFLNEFKGNAYLNQAVRSRAEALGYSASLYRPSPESRKYITYGHYINQAEQVLSKGLVSTGKYEQLLLDAFRSDLVYGDEDEGCDVID